MRIQAQHGSGSFYYDGRGGLFSWTTIVTVGGVGVLYMYFKGYGLADVMYVTKKGLEVAVLALEEGIDSVGAALESAKRELSYKLGLIDEKIDENSAKLEEKIKSEVGDVKRDLEAVGNDVKGISRNQERVHGMVESIETQIDTIGESMGTANRGIYLLCNVVAESMTNGGSGKKAGNNNSSPTSLYDELMSYTRNAMASFSSKPSATPPDESSFVTSSAPPMLPSANHGLRLLTESNGSTRSLISASSGRSIVEDMLGRSTSLTLPPSNQAAE